MPHADLEAFNIREREDFPILARSWTALAGLCGSPRMAPTGAASDLRGTCFCCRKLISWLRSLPRVTPLTPWLLGPGSGAWPFLQTKGPQRKSALRAEVNVSAR
jgi:hypothetical protein